MSTQKIKDVVSIKDTRWPNAHGSEKTFHESYIKSSLFKGRNGLYFCFLKSERIAHVVTILLGQRKETDEICREFVKNITDLPSKIAHLAAGEATHQSVLAEVLSLAAGLRLLVTGGVVAHDSGKVLVQEFEMLTEKLDVCMQPVSVTESDFLTHPISWESEGDAVAELPKRTGSSGGILKDINKGHALNERPSLYRSNTRQDSILRLIQTSNGMSIKDISAVVTDCSEKTIQRELVVLIRNGFVRRVGERRWSLYEASSLGRAH